MTVLSAQSIRRRGIFEPFCERTRHAESGMTYGLSAAGYDVRLRDEVVLGPGDHTNYMSSGGPASFSLAVTLEHFDIPTDVVAIVHDKSTLARMGVTVQNTVAEPGWHGYLTLELANHSRDTIRLLAGQPIAQVILHLLDEPTEQPYAGRYQDQPAVPVSARLLTEDEVRT